MAFKLISSAKKEGFRKRIVEDFIKRSFVVISLNCIVVWNLHCPHVENAHSSRLGVVDAKEAQVDGFVFIGILEVLAACSDDCSCGEFSEGRETVCCRTEFSLEHKAVFILRSGN